MTKFDLCVKDWSIVLFTLCQRKESEKSIKKIMITDLNSRKTQSLPIGIKNQIIDF